MRILHVITTLDVGGAEMHLLAQVRGQAARGHAVRVLYLKGAGSLATDFATAGAERVQRLSARSFPRLFSELSWCEVVHSHLLKADLLTAVVATLSGRRSRLISSKHNDEQVLTRPLASFVHRLIGRLPRRTIVLSDHVGRFFARYGGVPSGRQVRIYYGIDPQPFEAAAQAAALAREGARAALGLGPRDVVFVCVARFAPQKAHDVLLRAFSLCLGRWRAAGRTAGTGGEPRLLLVGGDPFGAGRERAERQARDLGLSSEVVFAGIRRDLPQLLGLSDAFVLASLWEGLGLVFLEAMAAGLPVLATQVSAVPEVVVPGETGLLVPSADPESLAGGFLRLAGDPSLRARMGAAGRERVRRQFGLERMLEETLAVYAGLEGPVRPPKDSRSGQPRR